MCGLRQNAALDFQQYLLKTSAKIVFERSESRIFALVMLNYCVKKSAAAELSWFVLWLQRMNMSNKVNYNDKPLIKDKL